MNGRYRVSNLAICVALVVLTVVVYAPVMNALFVNYDDNVYVTANARIAQGLSADNAVWSMTAFVDANWHPLTLLSHMLDVELFGVDPAGHHAMNLALHAGNVALLFWLLAVATGRSWPGAFVAALFAVHPLNVQTVAWISERKSLLSTAFWLLALLAHVGYRRHSSWARYSIVIALAAFALAAKPMAVTLPLTVVLVDFWPLGRGPNGRGSIGLRYARELAPVIAMAGACGVLTLLAQRAGEALQTVTAYPFHVRLGNAIVSYAWYLKAMVWPTGLAAFYPHPMSTQGVLEVALSAVLVAAIAAAVVAKRRVFPEWTMGWWWYVGTLLPVAGLIQVGSQAYADRYAYVPLIGIFIVVAWTALRFTANRPAWRRACAALGVAWIAALSLVTRAQLHYWHDSVSLFQRAIDVVPDNALAHNNLGMALVERGRMSDALTHFQQAVALAPGDTDARSNVGNALRALNRPAEAAVAYEQALGQAPNDPSIHYNLATALVDLGRVDDAVIHLREAVRLDPEYAKARSLLERIETQRYR